MKFSHVCLGLALSFGAFVMAQPEVVVERQSFESLKEEESLSTKDHLLVVSARFDDPGLISTENYLNEQGKSYKTLIASQEELTEAKLIDENGKGLYEGIILTEGALSFERDGEWLSAFESEEWELLWNYEALFGVRQVTLYTFPASEPENYGLSLNNVINASEANYHLNFTEEGQAILNVLSNDLTLNNAYAYQAKIETVEGIETTPLLVDLEGNVFAVLSVQDGRERLAFTMAQSEFSGHTEQLLPTMFNWLSDVQAAKAKGPLGLFSVEIERFILINLLFVGAFLLLNWLRRRRRPKSPAGLSIVQIVE